MSYLLPAGSGGMEQFYQQVFRRLREQMAERTALPRQLHRCRRAREALVGAETWREAFRISVEQSPEHAVSFLRERVKTEIKKFLREPPPGEQPHAAPAARPADRGRRARAPTGPTIQQDYLDEFGGKLAGLLPGNFTPQGSGPMKVLINYPADAKNEVVEDYLRSLAQPAHRAQRHRGLPAHRRPSRSRWCCSAPRWASPRWTRSATCCGGGRARWTGPGPTDLLRWRQRTGYDFGYLATREHHRVAILHRMLCALWNGKAPFTAGRKRHPSGSTSRSAAA